MYSGKSADANAEVRRVDRKLTLEMERDLGLGPSRNLHPGKGVTLGEGLLSDTSWRVRRNGVTAVSNSGNMNQSVNLSTVNEGQHGPREGTCTSTYLSYLCD